MMEQQVCNCITNSIPNAKVRARRIVGGWLIEVVSPDLNESPVQNSNRIERILESSTCDVERPFIIWKIFAYTFPQDRLSIMATLHTIDPSWDDDGIETVTLSASDSYLMIPEFDAEILTLGGDNGLKIEAAEAITQGDQAIMPYQGPQVNYLWMESMGGRYYISQHDWINQNSIPRTLFVKLRES